MKAKNLTEKQKTSKQGVQLAYVLDCIKDSCTAIDEGIEFTSDYEAIKWFFGHFDVQFNYPANKRYYTSLQDRIANFLQGLPSCFATTYWNSEIIEQGKAWGYCQTPKKEAEFVERWFSVLAFRLMQVADKVGYDITNLY